ncbi:MAG: hypothetical protein PHC66_01520 [Candidatus Nanoarchaeia archaeon]|nr:hypothetical protein [Candidatus Nanoarchaeia archaeon]MDD5239162.1 hypothetical protein [Candidatus Nanoarchaeia archaeon]
MAKKKFAAYCDEKLWKEFLKEVVERKSKAAVSESLEEAIRLWMKK